MNRIIVGERSDAPADTFVVGGRDALAVLPILRSDHFIEIVFVGRVESMLVLTQLPRLLRRDGVVRVEALDETVGRLLVQLGLHRRGEVFGKSVLGESGERVGRLAVGFQGESVDEEELLRGDGIRVEKKEKCAEKVRACANCKCGRKEEGVKVQLSKEELVEGINKGMPVGGCGKCELGDSFRCGSCPYKGLPAFKVGDKLILDEKLW